MDERERDEILWRLDERMERVDENFDRLGNRVKQNEKDIDNIKSSVQSNTETLGTLVKAGASVGTFLTAIISAVSAKLTGLL